MYSYHVSLSAALPKASLLLFPPPGIWLLLPFFTSLVSSLAVTKSSSHTEPESQPVLHAATLPHPPPHPQPDTKHPAHEDPAVVSAASEAKMTHLLEEQQLKQEHLLSQVKERLRLEVQDVKAQLEAAAAEVSGLVERMLSYQTDSRSAAAGLRLRIQALEAQNAKLSQEWSSIQLRPPPAPCPDTSSPPVQNHLTPELQQAMEKWLTDRLKKQDDRGSCSDCGRPMADKMADFALETQGASVISTRCSETYRIRSACVTLFGIPLWYPTESPRTVIQVK
ncbi:SUN domain-containing protein 2-like isoform X4 [Anarrhichthys ocellatus]|uniref:SUN domain-containing protein 2-like isoform X3 n=1 Tax=Anarrhichthys ocellatus TaxID=433405 RepID=UPI0012ED5C38|nr:SUN domain-containing protein 2-like isoform X3 [Anarrhichthys ocellatus]XP_031697861.1 SUN domain-containing protein 2-like isoform X4 [Anarrhichthys ocellatus]